MNSALARRALSALLAGAVASLAPAAGALTIGEGLEIVSRSGRDAQVAAAAVALAESGPRLAAAARRPAVDLFARETLLAYKPESDVGLGQPIPIGERDSFSFGLRVRQLLADFGRTEAALGAAGHEAEAARVEAALSANRASLRFILAYLRLLRAGRLLEVAGEEVTRSAAHRDDARALVEAGSATENDLLQAEVRLADALQRRLQAENVRGLAAAQVNSLLLRPLGQAVDAEEVAPAAGAAGSPGLEEEIAAAEERAELRLVRERLAAARARGEAARSERYPRLYVGGGFEYAENRYQVHEGNWSVLAGVDLPLYSGGATRERVVQADGQVALLERTEEQLRDAVALEVQEAFLARETARARVGVTGKAVEQARENLRLQRLRYAEGVGTSTEVLDAVSLAAAAEQNHLNARYDVIEAGARLDFAAGRDLVARWGAAPGAGPGKDGP